MMVLYVCTSVRFARVVKCGLAHLRGRVFLRIFVWVGWRDGEVARPYPVYDVTVSPRHLFLRNSNLFKRNINVPCTFHYALICTFASLIITLFLIGSTFPPFSSSSSSSSSSSPSSSSSSSSSSPSSSSSYCFSASTQILIAFGILG